MNIKNLSCLFLLFFTNFIHSSPFATRLMLANTEEKKQSYTKELTKQENPLFVQAKKCEENFVHARKQCLQADDCKTNKEYKQTRHLVISSIVQLIDHIKNLEDDTTSDINEKDEAENIKTQLIQLLESTHKR